jgi:hypothetical protein
MPRVKEIAVGLLSMVSRVLAESSGWGELDVNSTVRGGFRTDDIARPG